MKRCSRPAVQGLKYQQKRKLPLSQQPQHESSPISFPGAGLCSHTDADFSGQGRPCFNWLSPSPSGAGMGIRVQFPEKSDGARGPTTDTRGRFGHMARGPEPSGEQKRAGECGWLRVNLPSGRQKSCRTRSCHSQISCVTFPLKEQQAESPALRL